MPVTEVSPECKHLIQLAAKRLKGPERRAFIAEVAETLCLSNPCMTETRFGFGRQVVELGMNEKRTGLICYGNYEPCGKKKAEVASPTLEKDIRSLVDPESQADPKLKNTFAYSRITAKAVRQKLIDEKGWKNSQLPKERTISDMLNRMGYKLRKVQKTKPEKNSLNQYHL
ncbi:MAG: hypothetical protein K0U59_10820 [Gammaproteobacteria bacterium]|nr:hypothetical protein [Gammaproteobacteria bacterium]